MRSGTAFIIFVLFCMLIIPAPAQPLVYNKENNQFYQYYDGNAFWRQYFESDGGTIKYFQTYYHGKTYSWKYNTVSFQFSYTDKNDTEQYFTRADPYWLPCWGYPGFYTNYQFMLPDQ